MGGAESMNWEIRFYNQPLHVKDGSCVGMTHDDTMMSWAANLITHIQLWSEMRGLPNLGPMNFWKHLNQTITADNVGICPLGNPQKLTD